VSKDVVDVEIKPAQVIAILPDSLTV